MDLLTLQEAVDSSYDRGRYPDFFPVNIGDDFKLESRPELFVQIPNPREVKIAITSYRGLCWDAVHYYATIDADGINRCCYEDYDGGKGLIRFTDIWAKNLTAFRERKEIYGTAATI